MSNTPTRVGLPIATPPAEYSTDYMGHLVQSLSQNDATVQKTTQDYIMYGVENTADVKNARLLLISPGGIYFQILVDDSGNLTTLNLGT